MPLIDRILHPFKHDDHRDEHQRHAHDSNEIELRNINENEFPAAMPQDAGLAPPATTGEVGVVSEGHPVEVTIPGMDEPLIVQQVRGPEVEIHKTHIEQPVVHETHTHRDVVHEHHINQEIVHERHIEQPIITEKHIERPVVHEKHIERPVIHEKHFEKEIIHEKHIEQPVIHEKHYEKPVVHEQHIVVPIIHEQHIVKPIIHEVHVTQVVTDLVLPTATTQQQLSEAITSAANAALGQAGVVMDGLKEEVVVEQPEVRVEQKGVIETTQNQVPPMVVQSFEHPAPLVQDVDGAIVAAPLPIGASSTATLTQPNQLNGLSREYNSETTSTYSDTTTTSMSAPAAELPPKKQKRRANRRFFFFRKH